MRACAAYAVVFVVVAMRAPRDLARIGRAQRPVPLIAFDIDGVVLDVPHGRVS